MGGLAMGDAMLGDILRLGLGPFAVCKDTVRDFGVVSGLLSGFGDDMDLGSC